MSKTGKTIKIIFNKSRTVNRGSVRNFASARVNIGVETEVSLSNLDAESKWCINYVDTTLEAETAKELAKLDHFTQTRQSPQVDENIRLKEPPLNQEKDRLSSVPDDTYAELPWHRSAKDARLSMIPVTPQLSRLGWELYEKLKGTEKRTLRNDKATYKLWVTDDGMEFLQRWSKSSEGANAPSD
jgi:hypothetical protein